MDDLTRIHGIGRATAARLAEAGAGSFAALAGADPAALAAHPALRGVRASPADLAAWIAAAAALLAGRQAAHDAAAAAEPVHALPAPRLRIVGPPEGRWRAGRRWGPEPVEMDAAALGPEAVAALRSDAALVVTDPTDDPPPSGG